MAVLFRNLPNRRMRTKDSSDCPLPGAAGLLGGGFLEKASGFLGGAGFNFFFFGNPCSDDSVTCAVTRAVTHRTTGTNNSAAESSVGEG
jgi:hypothetical protein